ncbi:MAG: DUF6647 family protein, partial [Actinomycetota bacterium]
MRALMRAAVAATFLVCGLAMVAAPALAGKGDLQQVAGPDPSPDLMRALMAWAAPRIDLPVPAVLPRIVRKDHCALNAIARPGAECPDADGPGVRALYSSGVLWLNTEWRSDSIRDVSFLLHELVHHMQFHAGIAPLPCAGEALEKPAYEAHMAFLDAAGLDPYEVTGINGLYL